MAKLSMSKFNQMEKQTIRQHDEVVASYTIFEINGNKILQIDTYGSKQRVFRKKLANQFKWMRIF